MNAAGISCGCAASGHVGGIALVLLDVAGIVRADAFDQLAVAVPEGS